MLVRFQPINRLNAVLAVGADARDDRAGRDLGRAGSIAPITTTPPCAFTSCATATPRQIAAILRDVFTGGGGSPASAIRISRSSRPAPSFTRQSSFGASSQPAAAAAVGSSTTSTQSQQINTPTFGGGGAGDPGAGAGRVGEPADSRGGTRGGSGATGTDLAGLSTSTGGNSGPAPLPNVRITADVANNSLLIYASRDQYKLVERAIFELDKAPVQVAIDVTIAEVTLKNDLQYGVQYYFKITDGGRKGTVSFSAGDLLETRPWRPRRELHPRLEPRSENCDQCVAQRHRRQGAVGARACRARQPAGGPAGRRRGPGDFGTLASGDGWRRTRRSCKASSGTIPASF